MATDSGSAAQRFVGVWRLVGETADGEPVAARGPNPQGVIVYTAGGHMAVQIIPDRPRPGYKGLEPPAATAQAVLAGYTAYFGTYTVDERAGTVTHHRVGHVNPGFESDIVRRYEFARGGRLILRPVESKNEIVWERVT